MSDPQAKAASSQREAFFEAIRRAVVADGPAGPPTDRPTIDEAVARRVGSGDDLVATFVEQAEASGMCVHRTPRARLIETIIRSVQQCEARTAAVGLQDEQQSRRIETALHEIGLTLVDWRSAEGRERLFDADVGVTDVLCGIAETGTLVLQCGASQARGLSLIPPVHVAVLRAGDIVPDLLDCPVPLAAASAMTLVTGPSKTADIEGVLVNGVHGPGQVLAILLDDA